MESSIGIEDRIKRIYATLRPSEKKVAACVLENLTETGNLSIVELAEKSGVSQPTVIRFARALGFGGYRELRYVLMRMGKRGEDGPEFDPLGGFDLHPWDRIEEVPLKAINGAKAMLDDTLKALSLQEYRRAVMLLGKARIIDIYSVENSAVPANDLLNKLTYLGLRCRMHTDAYLQQIAAGHLSGEDVALAFSYSGSSSDTVKALRLAHKQGAKTIAVTNFSGAPLAEWADVCLYAGSGECVIYGNAIFSRVCHCSIVDMLYMGVILSDYERYAAALDASGRYIRDRGYHGA